MLIGEILSQRFGVPKITIEKALKIQSELGGYIGSILVQLGAITENQLIEALSYQLNIPVYKEETVGGIDISDLQFDLNIKFLLKNNFLPVAVKDSTVWFITNDPLNFEVISYLNSLGLDYKIFLATENSIKEYSKFYIDNVKPQEIVSLDVDDTEKLKEIAFEAPVIKYLNTLINRAVELRATDIHIEPFGDNYRIRFRIDGILRDFETIDESFYLAVVSRIKLLSSLDIAEKRLPQDGKFTIQIASRLIDVRVSTIPMIGREGVVLRLLYRERLSFDISTLGIEKDHINLLLNTIKRPFGMFLITGPTGSGKTTTLYSLLSILNTSERKIITIEDPVEYQIPGINQIQVRSDIGLTFAKALRSVLRHDPDVIMVGEIRDSETAEISVQSALTGHLVLSTLHTNDSTGSLSRLFEMGIEDFLINSAIISVSAQRIIRKVCPHCSYQDSYDEDVKKEYRFYEVYDKYKYLFDEKPVFRRGRGCEKCAGSGYKGRMAIFEAFEYTEDLKHVFINTKSSETVKQYLIKDKNFRTLREDGIIKVLKGLTTLEEVVRVT
jgi:type II secretory ATPase GspE/PulE/Tfp pilus assembly ATPase PilB-like protein